MTHVHQTNQLVEYITQSRYEHLDEIALGRAKERLIDSLGVLLVGHRAGKDSTAVIELFKGYGGARESSVAGSNLKLPMAHAAFINSLLMRAYDFEAVDAEAVVEGDNTTPAHISGTTVPATLAVGEAVRCTGKELLHALVIADDVTTRVLNASGFSVHDYFDGNGTANVFGAATAAGILLGLAPDELHGAFALAVNQMSGTMQNVFEKQITFKFPIALSAKSGIFAAQLALCGYAPGLADPLGGPRGYFDLFYSSPRPEKLLVNLGTKYHADCVIKPWPACRATHGSIDATLGALNGKTFTPDEVKGVTVHVAESVRSFVGEGFVFGMDKSYQGAFSIDFLVATAILFGAIRPEHFTGERMTDAALGAMLSKITVAGDLPPEAGSFKSVVDIELTSGATLSHTTLMPAGDIYKSPLSREDVLSKYYHNVEFGGIVSRQIGEAIVEMIDGLENVNDVSKLMQLIA